MASKKVEVEIVATDKASPKLDKVEKKMDALEADDAKINIDTTDLAAAESSADDLADSLGRSTSFLSGPTGIAAGAGLAAGALFAAADAAADMAVDAQVTADLTGATTEEASRLQVVWRQTGADVNDLNDILLNMNDVLADSPELADELGINLNDGANGVDRMLGLLGQLNASQLSANEKARIMGQLFGEEGVRQIGKLLVMFPDLEQAMDDVSDAQVIDDEDVEKMREFSAETAELRAQFMGWAAELSHIVTPAITGFFRELNDGNDSLTGAGIELALGEEAFRDFDRTMLDGLDTFEQVHAKVLEVTDSYHAANLAATEWANNQRKLNAELFDWANTAATKVQAAQIVGSINQTIINPPGTPAATVDQLGTYLTRNSARTGG